MGETTELKCEWSVGYNSLLGVKRWSVASHAGDGTVKILCDTEARARRLLKALESNADAWWIYQRSGSHQ